MKIRKMTASFGKLQNDTLELGDGLNIIYAPNESGKSTWCGFIKAMLYGIDSTAREKGGIKPDKVKFAPWSGVPMAGTMDIEYEGARITLMRKGRETAPMRDFSAVHAGSSDVVRGLDGKTAGETLLGVSKDVFERSAFIGQGNVALSGSSELEKRISAIVQTGEEKSSVIEAEERLKAAIRRRRYNKSGRLPEIEREMDTLRESVNECEREAVRGEELKRAKTAALERRDTLLARVAEARKETRRESLDKLSASRNEIKEFEGSYAEKCEKLVSAEKELDNGALGREKPKESRKRFELDSIQLRELDDKAKKGGSIKTNAAILAVLLILTVAAELLSDFDILRLSGFANYIPRIAAGLLSLAQFVRILLMRKKRKEIAAQKLDILLRYGGESEQAVLESLKNHESSFAAFEAAQNEKALAEKTLEAARTELAELEASLLKELDFNEGETEAGRLTKLLEEAELSLRSIREQSALWEGRQSVRMDPNELEKRLSELSEEYEKLTDELDALNLALDTLRAAGEDISHRVTPRLSARTAQLFSKLSAERYDSVMLDRDMKAAARPEGDTVPRETAFLSTGAVDQLYLAVRLAICELALPAEKNCPLILDDALVNFDDERCQKALELLYELSSERQIVLFTCHSREAQLVKDLPSVCVTKL